MTEERKGIAEDPSDGDRAPERLSREDMLDQLQAMARQIAGDAPPVLREASAVAAELAAIAARGTGPVAHTLADVTDDASLRFAERMETYAASVRGVDAVEAEASDDAEIDDEVADAGEPAQMEDAG